MLKHITIATALLFATACEIDRQESVGEEMREAGNALDDGWKATKAEAKDVGEALTEPRSDAQKRLDRTTRDFEQWVEKRQAEIDEATDDASRTTREAVASIEDDLKGIRDDVEKLGRDADEEWETAKRDIDERLKAIGTAIEGVDAD